MIVNICKCNRKYKMHEMHVVCFSQTYAKDMSWQVCTQLEGEALSDDEIDEMFRCADIACDLKDGH